MTKRLFLVIQSDNAELYVNSIVHCVEEERVTELYFCANNDMPNKQSDALKKIRNIRTLLQKLSVTHQIYKTPLSIMPPPEQVESRLIRIDFTKPDNAVKVIKEKVSDIEKTIIDVSGCSKRLSTDIVASFIPGGIQNICCFELDDEIYSDEWKQKGLSKRYYDLVGDDEVKYYAYVNFSTPGTTISSFNRMRSQGNIIKLLLVFVAVLGLVSFGLIQQGQNVYAQIATVIISLATAFGFVNDVFGLRDRFK
jgi:hypothetical protein